MAAKIIASSSSSKLLLATAPQCVILPHALKNISRRESRQRITTRGRFSVNNNNNDKIKKSTRKYVILRNTLKRFVEMHRTRKVLRTGDAYFCFKYPSLLFNFTLFVRACIHVGYIVGNPTRRQNPTALTKLKETTAYMYTHLPLRHLGFMKFEMWMYIIGVSSRGVKWMN